MSVSLTVMTFNLLEDQPEDSPNSWGKRRDLCVSVITNYSPIILCIQQGVKSQLEYLQQCLPGYDQFGISRKGSEDTSDEHCTIFYDKEKVELLEGGTFWLSESPSVPGSMSWGCEVPCIATWATFQLKGVEPPGFSFQIVNTNMDEFSPRSRRRSALLTWQHIASLPPSLPVIYCGGFNTQKESTIGRFLLGRSREHGVVGDMRDAWSNARVRKNVSLIRTYHGFKGNKQGALEFLKLIFRAFCLCWDRQTQDLHVDWILFRGRALIPVSSEVCEIARGTCSRRKLKATLFGTSSLSNFYYCFEDMAKYYGSKHPEWFNKKLQGVLEDVENNGKQTSWQFVGCDHP